MLSAKVFGVLVVIRSAVGQWDLVIDHSRDRRLALSQAHLAKASGTIEAALALCHAAAAAETFDHDLSPAEHREHREAAAGVPPTSADFRRISGLEHQEH